MSLLNRRLQLNLFIRNLFSFVFSCTRKHRLALLITLLMHAPMSMALPTYLAAFKGGITPSVLTQKSETDENIAVYCLKTTHLKKDYRTCLAEQLEYHYPKSEQRVTFARTFGGVARTYENHDGIFVIKGDIVRPPHHQLLVLMTEKGMAWDADNTDLFKDTFATNNIYQTLLNTYPNTHLGHHLGTSLQQEKKENGEQLFYVHYPILPGCTSCPALGAVTVALKFNAQHDYIDSSIVDLKITKM